MRAANLSFKSLITSSCKTKTNALRISLYELIRRDNLGKQRKDSVLSDLRGGQMRKSSPRSCCFIGYFNLKMLGIPHRK